MTTLGHPWKYDLELKGEKGEKKLPVSAPLLPRFIWKTSIQLGR